MASKNAEAVANDVLEKVRKGEKVVMGKIIEKRGYGKSMPAHPTKVTQTKSYQKVVAPYLERIIKLRDKIQIEMENKDLSKVQFGQLNQSLKDLTHDIQLLTGGSTENIFQITWKK